MKLNPVIASGCILILMVGVPARPQEQRRPSDERASRAPLAAEPIAATDADTAPPAAAAEASVLRLLRFNGAVKNKRGEPRIGVVGITFALYADQEGGAPLWLETQNVELDAQRRYTVLLGAAAREGLPLEIFSSGEARWLSIQVQGEEEQTRILLVSVPYAFKAADADRLGGRPASDFALTSPSATSKGPEPLAAAAGGGASSVKGSGTANLSPAGPTPARSPTPSSSRRRTTRSASAPPRPPRRFTLPAMSWPTTTSEAAQASPSSTRLTSRREPPPSTSPATPPLPAT